VVSSVNGSRINPPVDPVGDKTVERARREFMEAVRSGDRQTRLAIETLRDQVGRDQADRNGSDQQLDLRRNPDRMRAAPGSMVHLETARGPDRRPDGDRADDNSTSRMARGDSVAASLRRQDNARIENGGQDSTRQESTRQDPTRQGAARQQTVQLDSALAGTRPSALSDRRDVGTPPVDPVAARIPPGRPRPEPIGPPPPPGYRPPPPVAPEGTVLIGPVPGREALNLVGPTEARAGAVSAFGSLRLSSATPREVAERIAGFMETGELDTSPVRFAPIPAVMAHGDADAEPDDARQRDAMIYPDPAADRAVLNDIEDAARILTAS
jgi:hypothetical protein